MKRICSLTLLIFVCLQAISQQVGINTTGALPDTKAMLDISSTTGGLLIPRMTTAQRDAITSPPNSLLLFNSSTNSLNMYTNSGWKPLVTGSSSSNLVDVYALADLPTPSSGVITLDANKMYIIHGFVDISPNYLSLNGAGLRGIDPGKDGIMSSVSGGILRSNAVSVFLENIAVIPLSGTTKAYDFTDATGTKFCNIFSGCSVVEVGIPSLGVGQVSGFKAVTFGYNYWNCANGVKVTGTMGKFCSNMSFYTGINSGNAAIEFLAALVVEDIDISNNYFVYTGSVGIKVNTGASVNRGRMTTNMFRGVTTNISGFDSYSLGWDMLSNTGIPDSRSYCFSYMTANASATTLTTQSVYYKIAGTTTTTKQQRFTSSNNRMTYTGVDNITGRITVVIGAKSPANNCDFTIGIAKNGTIITTTTASMAATSNGQSFQITLFSEVDFVTNDYIEVFIKKNNTNTSTLTVDEMQFRVVD